MLFSLLVPCYNAERFIDSFLINIGKLRIAFNEVLFYDDGSTDKTIQLLRSAGFTVIEGKTNKGPGYARNRLAEVATGDYIHFHDIDDEFTPVFLDLVIEKLETEPADVVLGNADWVNAATREIVISWRYKQTDITPNPLAYFVGNALGIINAVYKKDKFLSVDGFNENIKCWEDADLHVRLAASQASFVVINQVIAFSLRHNNGISNNQAWCWHCRLKFVKMYLQQYRDILDRSVLETEVVRIKNAFVNEGNYKQLAEIVRLKKHYGLSFKTGKITVINWADKLLPAFFIKKLLKLFQK